MYTKSKDNKRRAKNGHETMEGYVNRVHGQDNDDTTNLGDLLSDLMHWCAISGHAARFDAALKIARGHFKIERRGKD